MIVTNKCNLPKALEELAKNSQFEPTDKHYSTTTILSPTREIILTRRHFNEIETDVVDYINRIFGTATHSLIEKFDKTGYAEIYFKEEIKDGYYLTGKCDLYNEEDNSIEDYKTASVYKIKLKDFEDWKKQGLIYSWLAIKKGYYVNKIKFHALLKDWSAREKRKAELKGEFYPECQVYTYQLDIKPLDLIDIEKFIRNKFDELIEAEKLSDDELLDCGKNDTWYTGDVYAVYKDDKSAKATKLCDTKEEAEGYILNKMNGKGIIKYRAGEYRKCQDYCEVCKFCKYYEERKAE